MKIMTPQDKLISDAINAMTGKGERERLFDEREHAFFAGYIEAIKEFEDKKNQILKCLGYAQSKDVEITLAEEQEETNEKTEDLKAEVAALRGQMQDNPWCKSCREADCSVRSDGTCSMIRKYLSAYNPHNSEVSQGANNPDLA